MYNNYFRLKSDNSRGFTIELRAWDQYKDVLDNINMIEKIREKELEEDYEI